MRWSSSLLGFLGGLVYAAIYLVLAFGAAGAGHGTGIFFAAILPYGLGLLFFPMVGFLAGDLRPFLSKVFFVFLLTIHYALVINFLRWDLISEPTYVEKMWNYSPLSIILPAGFYLLGQLAIWAFFIRALVVPRGTPPNKALQLTAR